MVNWNVDEDRFRKEDPEGYKLWRLEQLLNYGLDQNDTLKKDDLKKNWCKIKENIDPYISRYLEYLLWGKLYLLPDNLTFWNWPVKKMK